MPPQHLDWTCSACSLDWLLRATAIDETSTVAEQIQAIGYPEQINAQVGLTNGSGFALQDVLLRDYEQTSEAAWLGFDAVYALATRTTGLLGGSRWNHWVAIRGARDGAILIANSAPGYRGIFDVLTRESFERLGPFAVVWLEGV